VDQKHDVIAGVGIKEGYVMQGARDNGSKPPHPDPMKPYDPTKLHDPNTQNDPNELIDPGRLACI